MKPIKIKFFKKQNYKFITRRNFLKGSLAVGLSSFIASIGFSKNIQTQKAKIKKNFNFIPVSANTKDTITLPKGYNWRVVIKWGDPLWSNAEKFNEESRGTSLSQQLAFGDNNDGMEMFVKGNHHILAVNNEYTNRDIIHGNRASKKPEKDDDIRKNMLAHGVSIIEIREKLGKWTLVKDSIYNRRLFPNSPMQAVGPASGHKLLQTRDDPKGRSLLGTWNNCGSGKTPWGTFLTCEENFNGYFTSTDKNYSISSEMERYGIGRRDWGYNWFKIDERFDISKHPNEPNRCGYVVEIDPLLPNSIPKKLTALGRFKHENAEIAISKDGYVVVYMGDDERGEYIYKFVSYKKYKDGEENNNLLNNGKLYVAKFNNDGSGKWIELSLESTGMNSLAEICIYTRIAASKVGATSMDRPEWVSVNTKNQEVYCCLTNNTKRKKRNSIFSIFNKIFNNSYDSVFINGPNPRGNNKYGQIVRWIPNNNDHASINFQWDLFLMAGNPKIHSDDRAGSKNITKSNMFNSPDGLSFDSNGLIWIQTDGKYSNKGDFKGQGNNQMLVGNPKTGEIKRFMVGPRQCEVTGLTWSEDKKTMFIGIQHPGERGGDSNFPDGDNTIAKSSVIAIKKNTNESFG